MSRYLIFLFLFAIALDALLYLLTSLFPSLILNSFVFPISGYFFLLTAAFHYGLVRSSQGKPALFIRYYMAATSFKLLIHMMLLLILVVLNKAQLVPLVVTFLIFYLFFTVFEVTMAYRQSRVKA